MQPPALHLWLTALATLSPLLPSITSSASPLTQALASKKTFTLTQSPVRRTSRWNGPMSMRRAYLKHGLDVPVAIAQAARVAETETVGEFAEFAEFQRAQQVHQGQLDLQAAEGGRGGGTGSTPVRPVKGDVEFLITAQVGNHNLSLDLDTGSSDLWVFSTLQPADQRQSRPVSRVYDPQGSNAKELEGHAWQIRYGDMSGAQGQVYLDKVSVGGIAVENQAVEAAASVSRTFTRDNANDGLLGMAFSRLNTVKPKAQKTWFDNVRPQLAQPLFTAALKRRNVGTYDFGFIDKTKYTGEIIWHTISGTKGFWDFTPTQFRVGNGPVVDYNISAIADTGTSLWYMPKTVVDAYWAKVPGASFNAAQQGFVFPCAARLPDITLFISGKPVTVAGANMNYQQISITTCFGGMQRADRMPFAIFGDTFMKGLFTVFEAPLAGAARIGFAQQPLEKS